jgi:hypothetical protein
MKEKKVETIGYTLIRYDIAASSTMHHGYDDVAVDPAAWNWREFDAVMQGLQGESACLRKKSWFPRCSLPE